MNLTFFGTDEDLRDLWTTLFAFPGMRVLERDSVPDQPNRWFDDWALIANYLESGGRGLAAWYEPAGGRPRVEQVAFRSRTQAQLG